MMKTLLLIICAIIAGIVVFAADDADSAGETPQVDCR